jgi:ABC-type branched-subunit amino acid transport system substrate-binding protein
MSTRRHHKAVGLKALGLVLAATLVLGSCGGGGDDDAADDKTDTTTEAKELTATSGFDGSVIKLGVLVPLSGLPAIIGKPLAAGQEVYWKWLNEEEGGIAGKYKVEVVIEDTLYETNTTVQKYNKIKNDVVMFSQVMGTPHNLALLPLLKEDKIVVAPASQDSFWVREQYMFPVIEPYQVDVVNAIDYWMGNGGSKTAKVCAITENDVYGEAGLEGLNYAADKYGFDVVTTAKFKLGDSDFTAQVNELKSKGCEMVWATALPTEFSGILGTAAKLSFEPRWIAQSPAWVDVLANGALKDYLEKNVWVAATGPALDKVDLPAMKAILDRIQKYRPDLAPNYYFTFGYLQAIAERQLLERAVELGDLSRDGIVKAMNTTDKLTFDGLVGDYGYGPPDKRNPSRQTTVFKINAAKPFALEELKFNFTTDAAKAFVFKAQKL